MLECALISSDEAFRHAVFAVMKEAGGQARLVLDLQISAEELDRDTVAKVVQAGPKLAFLDLGQDPSGVGGIRTLNQEAPELILLVGGPALTAEGLLSVIRSGASEYLPRPFSFDETLEAFHRVRRRAVTTPSGEPAIQGKVTTVFSAKGGTGVTTICTSLAIALRMLTEKEVLLLDLAPTLGTAGVAMGMHPRYTYVDVVRNFHRIDEELFRSFLETHDSGVHLLASPMSSVDATALSGDEVHDLIALAKRHFDYVIVDGGSFLGDLLPTLVDQSDDRLLVVTPELPTLRNLKHALDLYGRTNGRGPAKVILNKYKEGMGLSARDIEDGLKFEIAAIFGKDDARVLESINLGKPEVLAERSRFSANLMALGRKIAGSENITLKKRGFLSGLFRSPKRVESGRKENG
ncbi:MAG: AAA family ATPase [Gemmatimonadetes bacterium]|nr:AAA family ATPase [Gemmatimonadota bacterium]NNM07442.1 AAA family ATPase [Gemmatimonadota bacterium]